jgi:hypothetical protein
VPSVAIALPSHCPSPLSPLVVMPSGRGGLARPAAALPPPLPLPRSLRRAALATATLPPPPPRCRHLRHTNPPLPCCLLSSLPPRYPHHPDAVLPLQLRCHHHRHAATSTMPPLPCRRRCHRAAAATLFVYTIVVVVAAAALSRCHLLGRRG